MASEGTCLRNHLPGYAQGVAERMKRYRLMEDCAEATADCIAFAKEVLRNEDAPIVLRFMAFDRLMNRAYGLPFQAVDISMISQSTEVQKIIHEVRWMAPDPNDKSVRIEHQDD
jgi:hypothetical protein